MFSIRNNVSSHNNSCCFEDDDPFGDFLFEKMAKNQDNNTLGWIGDFRISFKDPNASSSHFKKYIKPKHPSPSNLATKNLSFLPAHQPTPTAIQPSSNEVLSNDAFSRFIIHSAKYMGKSMKTSAYPDLLYLVVTQLVSFCQFLDRQFHLYQWMLYGFEKCVSFGFYCLTVSSMATIQFWAAYHEVVSRFLFIRRRIVLGHLQTLLRLECDVRVNDRPVQMRLLLFRM